MDSKTLYMESTRHFLAPIQSLLDDEEVADILINGPDTIYYERKGILHLSDCHFPSVRLLMAAAINIAEYSNRRIDPAHHSMDGRLPDGSRVHIIVPPAARQGICISIRKFKKSSFNIESLVRGGSFTSEVAEFLRLAVLLHKNTVISGGTGTGKTSMLNALSTAIPDQERIIVIEDSSELQLNQPHTVYLEAQPQITAGIPGVSIRDLFVDTLRMRPDRIVVGEIRRGEALDLIQSMLSGHEGSLTTVHANTPRDAMIRLETLCLMSDVDMPVYVARMQVASAIHLVIQTSRFADGSRRLLYLSECLGLDKDNQYIIKDIYRFRYESMDKNGRILGNLYRTGYIPSFAGEPFDRGMEDYVKETAGVFVPRNKDHGAGENT